MPISTTEELTTLFDQGSLASSMAHRFGLNDQADIQVVEARCADLHNAGTVDLLRLVENGVLQDLSGAEFFMAMYVFCHILPELGATPARMMACVEALVARGGEDMAANEPNAAFRAWCKKDPRRAHEVIAAARGDDNLASRHLTFALDAIDAVAEARQIMLECDDDARRPSAITALGRIEDHDATSQGQTIVAFNMVLDSGASDNLCANILHAIAAMLARGLDAHLTEAVDLVSRLVADANELTVHQSARILWAYPKALRPEIIDALLKALTHINPANKGTVRELDNGLRSLMDLGYDEAAIAYVTRLFSRQQDNLELAELGGFTRSLLSGPPERLSPVVVQWLMSGAPRLCSGLAHALRGSGIDGPPIDLRADDLAVPASAQMFICRKAIGWFFFKPTTAASVVVSILRTCDEETAQVVQKLLVETLLLNYGGLRDYLSNLALEDPAKSRIDLSLAETDAYLAALRTVPPIKELEPSEHHRRIASLRMSDQMRDIQKQAQSQSVLLSLVKHSVLLYGNRSLSFIRDGQNALRPMEMDLKPYGISFETPRAEIIDPVGLDLTIRVFRAEKMTS